MKFAVIALAAVTLLSAADLRLGKTWTKQKPVPIATLLAQADDYNGKEVSVQGKIVEVCQEMGCWMDLVNDSGQKIRIKVNDGEIVFPKDCAGKSAIAQGKFTKEVLTREQAVARAKEDAEDSGKKFDPSTIKSGTTYYQIQGSGAIIMEN